MKVYVVLCTVADAVHVATGNSHEDDGLWMYFDKEELLDALRSQRLGDFIAPSKEAAHANGDRFWIEEVEL